MTLLLRPKSIQRPIHQRCYNLRVSQSNESSRHEFVAAESEAGQRLDQQIASRFSSISRTRVQELIEAGLVLVNSRPAKGSHRLRTGERIQIQIQPRPPLRAEAESIPLDILYEDDDVIAVNKPAGMTVHSGAGTTRGTLVNALLGRGQVLSQGGDALRPGIVHRLDKDTSGIILVAKNDAAHAKLSEAFRQRQIKKIYLALVQGLLKQDRGTIDLAIARDPKRRTRMTARRSIVLGNAREARTDWRVLARIDTASLLEVQLHTGRTALRRRRPTPHRQALASRAAPQFPPRRQARFRATAHRCLDRSPRAAAARSPYIPPATRHRRRRVSRAN